MNSDTRTFGGREGVTWHEEGAFKIGAPGANVWDGTFR